MEIGKLIENGLRRNKVGLNIAEQVSAHREIIKKIELAHYEAINGEEDGVKRSGFSRQLFQISKIVCADQSARVEQVAQLKRALAEGSYFVGSSNLAKSLVSYARELPERKEV